jgi:hypothetical protein
MIPAEIFATSRDCPEQSIFEQQKGCSMAKKVTVYSQPG